MPAKPYRACSCRDPQTKRPLGKKCPDLGEADHGHWYARYEVVGTPTGKRRQPRIGPYDTERECAQALALVRSDGPTVDEILDDYMGQLTCGERTQDNYRRSLRVVRELIGSSRAKYVTGEDVAFMVQHLLAHGKRDGTGLSKRTVDMAVALLRAAYELAAHRRRLSRRSIPTDPETTAIAL